MKSLAAHIKTVYAQFDVSERDYWLKKLKDIYDLDVKAMPGVHNGFWIVRQIYNIFSPIPPELIKECGVRTIILRDDMGPNRPYYPNHGYFINQSVTLNSDIFHHPDMPDDFMDHRGYFLTRPQQTLVHEFGHGYDFHHGDLSKKEAWLKISEWSETSRPGLEKLHIKDDGMPELIGEWYYSPKAKFTRFYAKRNPWDDWADSFSFYVAGLKDKVPSKKAGYFSNLLGRYY